ncbi:3-oxo-5-alpha-steroid 4-dehydrogenase [Cordyceps fumosorosea ARSEF 2679]|uniref:3-oxo-5-alpha-steroid 4-dehydrogenase n=1 Tax=Cordyceps fumosorosea (strain ARSEF 2679) TaxID=1081104 RepID=A0A167MXN0_CORFA|nr:3-oxo-5-alpha-steroid 4-dehydrogenase [Cordyceps fumosorosea ARSEF 2679]OAA54874.1 3-oxo-5-alpha-steroid 4-dehydrogenase [Cordyceps fumosorosea ARSEF 2679]
MAASTTLKLTNRSPKQPIKRLPASVELPAGATVEDVKKAVAKQAGISDFNRIGLFDTATKKTLKDRQALIANIPAVADAGEVLVKDLGPQIAWRTVFLIEYFGPIPIHAAVIAARPYIFPGGDAPMSRTQWLSFALIAAHFLKREYETAFVHKFSANTMPVANVFKNSFFYWASFGLLAALSLYWPRSLAATASEPALDAVGTALCLFGEAGNALVHHYLSTLRPAGSTERKIPAGYGFGLVTCPNYMYEVLAWVGIIIVSRDWAVTLSIAIGGAQMYVWAKGKEKAYRKEFGDKYKKKRFVMLPGLL